VVTVSVVVECILLYISYSFPVSLPDEYYYCDRRRRGSLLLTPCKKSNIGLQSLCRAGSALTSMYV
jgi:hypothetical protein